MFQQYVAFGRLLVVGFLALFFAIVWEVVIDYDLAVDLVWSRGWEWAATSDHNKASNCRKVEGDQWWGCFVQFVVKKIKHKVRSPHRQVSLPVESPDTLDFSRIGRRRKDFE